MKTVPTVNTRRPSLPVLSPLPPVPCLLCLATRRLTALLSERGGSLPDPYTRALPPVAQVLY